MQDVYRCTIDAELFGRKIGEARELADRLCPVRAVIATKDLAAHKEPLEDWAWEPVSGTEKATCRLDPGLRNRLVELGVPFETEESEGGAGSELREQVEAIERWYLNDWMALDPKLRTSIVEGISVFDQPQVASMFCPPPPDPDESIHMYSAAPDEDPEAVRPMPGLRRRLPPLAELIEGGRVLDLNMPAGANPALGRAIGVLLKNAWIQALLRRPAEAARRPGCYLRPAVFICDEYQAFATVGQDDPAGDEKAFALTRLAHLLFDGGDHLVGSPLLRLPARCAHLQPCHEPVRVKIGTGHPSVVYTHECFDVLRLNAGELLGHLEPFSSASRSIRPSAVHVAEAVPWLVPGPAEFMALDPPRHTDSDGPGPSLDTGVCRFAHPEPFSQFARDIPLLDVPQPILGFASGVEDPQTLFRPGLFLPTLGFPLLRHFDSSLRAIVDQSARNDERADA